jgi:hypothetical protein
MLRLEPISRDPFWLDLLPGVRIQFRPVSVASMLLARSAAGEVLRDGREEATTRAGEAFTRSLARSGIVGWEGIGDPLVWQLVRRYPSGPSEDVRAITKPEVGSVVVRVNGAAVAGLTIDHLTGLVTFSSAPAAQPYADFRFDVPCRFDTDHLPVVATAYHLQQVSLIAIVEIRA